MKKITAILLATALLMVFTGCNNTEGNSESVPNSDNSSSSTVTSQPEGSADGVPESAESVESVSDVPESKLSAEAQRLLGELKVTSFVGPDGITMQAADADDIFDGGIGHFIDQTYDENGKLLSEETTSTVLKYDFAYIRYARPYFYMGAFPDEETFKERDEETAKLPEPEWFKIKAGDTLDCGLTVKRVEYLHNPVMQGTLNKMEIELDGELTLEGTLFITTNDSDYLLDVGDIQFVPDPTVTKGIPVISDSYDPQMDIFRASYINSDIGYVESDAGDVWVLGNIDDTNIDQEEIFGGNSVAHVRVTLKNIHGAAGGYFV
ncbi:MAG: hypothetical protein HDR72_05100, partial [Ruminococcaceae bacterium]|nr:hypothetical protein [Oscillospiraceae bacterium]